MLPARACYFIGLNAVRFLSVVSLLLVFSSSIFVMVNDVRAVNRFMAAGGDAEDCDYIEDSTVPNQTAGVFWAIVNRILIILEVITLLLAELSPPIIGRFFARFFPVIGPNFGLGALGIFECLIGATILSHHVDDFTLVSAFFLFSVGCINMLLGLIFREKAKEYRSITAYRDARRGILPQHNDNRPHFGAPSKDQVAAHFAPVSRSSPPGSFYDEKSAYGGYGSSEYADRYEQDYRAISASKAGYGFGRQGEKAAGLRGFIIASPPETLSRYASHPTNRPASVASSITRGDSPRRGRSPAGERLADTGSLERSRSPSPNPGYPVPTFKSSPTAL